MLFGHRLSDLTNKALHRPRILDVVIGEDVGIRETKQRCSTDARIRRMILEIRVTEFRHPMIGIVRRVVDALGPAETPVRYRYSQMIVEPCEIRSAAWISHLRLQSVGRQIRF